MSAEHRLDPNLLDAVAATLDAASAAALEASHELLAHYVDTGDAATQRALDTLVDNAADALRALTDSFADISGELAASAVATDRSRRAKAAQFTGLSRRGREPGA